MTEPRACPQCLRRSWLLAHLAPYIERFAPGRRSLGLFRLSDEDLAAAVAPELAAKILAEVGSLSEERLRADLDAASCWAVCRHDPLYPVGLRDVDGAPWSLIGRGDPSLLSRLEPESAVAVVGSRRATTYGRETSRALGRELASAGLAVLSGLAFGIEGCAHRGALEEGLTVAVLGSGADVAYPAAHRSLWRRIQELGLVLSELPPGCGVWRWSFPARNRIMAAISGMTVVVEAAEGSGSMITADLAADLGRDLGAVPGPVGSRLSVGPNNLLADGACLIRGPQDVLDAMLGTRAPQPSPRGPRLNHTQRAVLGALEEGAETCGDVVASAGLSTEEALIALATLESLGYVNCSTTSTYSRTQLRAPLRALGGGGDRAD